MNILNIEDLKVYYGGVQAVRGVSFSVSAGEAVVLIGANGMGKTSILRALLGLIPSSSSVMEFFDVDLREASTRARVMQGISYVPESRELFGKMSVLDNLRLGMRLHHGSDSAEEQLDRMLEIFPVLKQRLKQCAGTLSGGEQQMLAISRALMQLPKLLCLDEPSLGLAPQLIKLLFEKLDVIRESGTAILLVEQQARQALAFGDRGYVISLGSVVRDGSCQDLAKDPMIKKDYLGI